MPFHIEVSTTTLHHARAFNLDEEELRRQVLEPWMAGRTIALGDREWVPRDSSLRVLEGPHLDGPDLSFGQGWANAERSGRDVTKEVLAKAERDAPPLPDAVRIEGDTIEEAVAALAGGAEPQPLDPVAAQAAIDRRDPAVAAVIIVTRRRSEPEPPRS